MMLTKNDILKNGVWPTPPPLLFSLSLMALVPNALTSAQFNEGIPVALITIEGIGQIVVFAMPALFSIGLSTTTQKRGLAVYFAGLAFYCLSYGTQNFFPIVIGAPARSVWQLPLTQMWCG